MRLLAGLEDVTSGRILIGHRDVTDIHPKERDVAMVFQSYALYPHMSVKDNIAFGLRMRKLDSRQIDHRVGEVARTLGIEHLLRRNPGQLSGGERQRVALGRAIIRCPSVFLLDEPLSNLDAKLRTQTRVELKKLHQRLETTFIHVTHDQLEAMTIADRIAVMNSGVLEQVGTPEEIYNTPANVFVAGFIGTLTMNFFRARLNSVANGPYLDAGLFRLPCPLSYSSILASDSSSEFILGIRPEHMYVYRGEALCAEEISVRARIELVETTGNGRFIHLENTEQRFLASVSEATSVQTGEVTEFAFNTAHLHIFDSRTGRAVHIKPQ